LNICRCRWPPFLFTFIILHVKLQILFILVCLLLCNKINIIVSTYYCKHASYLTNSVLVKIWRFLWWARNLGYQRSYIAHFIYHNFIIINYNTLVLYIHLLPSATRCIGNNNNINQFCWDNWISKSLNVCNFILLLIHCQQSFLSQHNYYY